MIVKRTCPACHEEYSADIAPHEFAIECPWCHQANIVRFRSTPAGFCDFCADPMDDHFWNMTPGSIEHGCRITLSELQGGI